HAPGRSACDCVMVRRHLVLAVLAPDDCGDRVCLNDQVSRQALGFLLCFESCRLVRIADRNEIRHIQLLPLARWVGERFERRSWGAGDASPGWDEDGRRASREAHTMRFAPFIAAAGLLATRAGCGGSSSCANAVGS